MARYSSEGCRSSGGPEASVGVSMGRVRVNRGGTSARLDQPRPMSKSRNLRSIFGAYGAALYHRTLLLWRTFYTLSSKALRTDVSSFAPFPPSRAQTGEVLRGFHPYIAGCCARLCVDLRSPFGPSFLLVKLPIVCLIHRRSNRVRSRSVGQAFCR